MISKGKSRYPNLTSSSGLDNEQKSKIDHIGRKDTEESYVKCKFGNFKCIYCTHGGCSINQK
ncbi:protein of unknown function [[Clostridium] ultunense Esp]|uniref:Uncharacterized protein n=1 Tax=[Clostridium] ultunense Esp TaxID=1288971 RepID=A0A1M4PKH0_9FIRM|nr:protein of unknown function [[Clostridium] ultunense Esp]